MKLCLRHTGTQPLCEPIEIGIQRRERLDRKHVDPKAAVQGNYHRGVRHDSMGRRWEGSEEAINRASPYHTLQWVSFAVYESFELLYCLSHRSIHHWSYNNHWFPRIFCSFLSLPYLSLSLSLFLCMPHFIYKQGSLSVVCSQPVKLSALSFFLSLTPSLSF